jgi:hypothetical protein
VLVIIEIGILNPVQQVLDTRPSGGVGHVGRRV